MRLWSMRAINEGDGLVDTKDNELGEPWASVLLKEGRCGFPSARFLEGRLWVTGTLEERPWLPGRIGCSKMYCTKTQVALGKEQYMQPKS